MIKIEYCLIYYFFRVTVYILRTLWYTLLPKCSFDIKILWIYFCKISVQLHAFNRRDLLNYAYTYTPGTVYRDTFFKVSLAVSFQRKDFKICFS